MNYDVISPGVSVLDGNVSKSGGMHVVLFLFFSLTRQRSKGWPQSLSKSVKINYFGLVFIILSNLSNWDPLLALWDQCFVKCCYLVESG